MPPSLVLLALLAIAVPAASRALLGRPRLLLAAVVASGVAAMIAQAVGDIARVNLGVVGDAQLGAAAVASAIGTALVALAEPRPSRSRR